LGTGVRGNGGEGRGKQRCGIEGRERGKLKSFELDPTIRMEVIVTNVFRTLTYISA